MEKVFEVTKRKTEEDYTSMEKYVLSKLKIAEKTIQDLASENELLNKKINAEKHKLNVQQLIQLKTDFIENIRRLDEAYFKEHNTYRPTTNDILDEFVNWLELGGYEIYVK